jgi:hypothetical protein
MISVPMRANLRCFHIGEQRGYADTSIRRLHFQRLKWKRFKQQVRKRR